MGGDLGARVSESCGNLQHISEREPDDWDLDPSLHPTTETMFMEKSKQSIRNGMVRKKSQMMLANSNSMGDFTTLKKASSCSTIYIDDSTVSQPNLKNTIKCVSLAIYYHIKNRNSDAILDIFDERKQPLTREAVPVDYDKYNPDHRQIYKFIRTLFNAAQLTAECAIITLVYLERLLTYAEVDTRYVPIKFEILTGQVDSVIKIFYMEVSPSRKCYSSTTKPTILSFTEYNLPRWISPLAAGNVSHWAPSCSPAKSGTTRLSGT